MIYRKAKRPRQSERMYSLIIDRETFKGITMVKIYTPKYMRAMWWKTLW